MAAPSRKQTATERSDDSRDDEEKLINLQNIKMTLSRGFLSDPGFYEAAKMPWKLFFGGKGEPE